MKVFVTGGTGFIGSRLLRVLTAGGHRTRLLLRAEERRYVVGSVRFVTQALVTSGEGWLDAEPEIRRLRPEIYAGNEDGDRPEKRRCCEDHGIR